MVGLRNRVLTSGSVGMGIRMGIPMGIPVVMGWVWGLKCHHHGSPAFCVGFYVLLCVYTFIFHCVLLLCLGLLCTSCTIFIIK